MKLLFIAGSDRARGDCTRLGALLPVPDGDGNDKPDPEQSRTKQLEEEQGDEGRAQSTGCTSTQVGALTDY
jgi:hypothetical protein